MITVVATTAIVGASSGSTIRRKTWPSLAPSTRAASSSSVLMPLSPADRMTMANPVSSQTPTMIRNRLFQGCSMSQATGSPPGRRHDGVERPDVGVELVHEPPDHGRRHEADRERQEDDRLDACSRSGPGRRARATSRPRPTTSSGSRTTQSDVVAQRDERVGLAEEPLVVLEPDEVVAPSVLEAPDDRGDRRIDEEHAEERQRRREPQPRPQARLPSVGARAGGSPR